MSRPAARRARAARLHPRRVGLQAVDAEGGPARASSRGRRPRSSSSVAWRCSMRGRARGARRRHGHRRDRARHRGRAGGGSVTAIDVSEDALALAGENAEWTGWQSACSSCPTTWARTARRALRPRRLQPSVRRARGARHAPARGARLGALGARRARADRQIAAALGRRPVPAARWRRGGGRLRTAYFRPARGGRLSVEPCDTASYRS